MKAGERMIYIIMGILLIMASSAIIFKDSIFPFTIVDGVGLTFTMFLGMMFIGSGVFGKVLEW